MHFKKIFWMQDLLYVCFLCVCVCGAAVHYNIIEYYKGGVFTYDVFSGVFYWDRW